MNDIQELQRLVEASNSILITSHISPDPDAVCSLLLLITTLKQNFPGKEIKAVLEETPVTDLTFLNDYGSVQYGKLIDEFKSSLPDLVIIVDANNFDRCSRDDGPKIRESLQQNNVKTAIIDHHEPDGKDSSDVYIHRGSPAATEDVYVVAKTLGWQWPEGYAQTAMLGILSDTYRFKYSNPKYKETFEVASELIEAGASIEEIESKLERYSSQQLFVLDELIKNMKVETGYTYSYISDEFAEEWLRNNKPVIDFKNGCDLFVNEFVRNIDSNRWGFIVYQELSVEAGCYSVSLRSISGTKDVSHIAAILGGGGHKPAAGAKLRAASIQEALKKVKEAIQ
jgi:phosphoesterase RecJ-like protein